MKTSHIVPFVFLGYSWTVFTEDIYIQTNGDYNYTIVGELDPETEKCGQLTFDVMADGNAFMALLSGDSDSQPLYEIVFGLNSNAENYIRREKLRSVLSGKKQALADTFIHYPTTPDKFTVIWINGTITAGGPTWSANMTWTDPNPLPVKHIAVTTVDGMGYWNFTTPVLIPKGCEIPVELNETCQCLCSSLGVNKWAFLADSNLTTEEIKIIMEPELKEIRKHLSVDKTNTSAYVRTKTSATDNRVSSKSMGILGILILTLVLLLFVVSDCLNVFKKPSPFPRK